MEAKKVFVVGKENEIESEIGSRSLNIEGEVNIEERQCSEVDLMEMEFETADAEKSSLSDEDEYGNDIVVFRESGGASHNNVVFSREAPLVMKEDLSPSACPSSAEKLESRLAASERDYRKNGRKLSRVDRIELGRLFQGAVSSRDWELAESLILLADFHTFNDALCISLDSIWFLTSQHQQFQIPFPSSHPRNTDVLRHTKNWVELLD